MLGYLAHPIILIPLSDQIYEIGAEGCTCGAGASASEQTLFFYTIETLQLVCLCFVEWVFERMYFLTCYSELVTFLWDLDLSWVCYCTDVCMVYVFYCDDY